MTQGLIDSHCHLNLLDIGTCGDVATALARAEELGIHGFLCVSIDLESLPQVLALASGFPHVWASVGVHPNVREGSEPAVADLLGLARHDRVVAIGETGLDYHYGEGDLEWQRERFRIHVRAARAIGKPLIIHTREARADTLAVLQEEGAQEVGGVMHCFTEDWDTAQQAMALGFYISFSGVVTFRNAEELREVARLTPLDRMLIETDTPYLAPVPHRGKPNQPAYVRHVAERIADLRGIPLESLAAATTRNFFTLFNPPVMSLYPASSRA